MDKREIIERDKIEYIIRIIIIKDPRGKSF